MLRETIVQIADNSGARRAKQIGFLGAFYKKNAQLGDLIIVAIPHRRRQRRFITKNIYLAVVVTKKQNTRRASGIYVKFKSNKVILLSEQGKLVGSRLYGPIANELKKTKIARILTLAKAII